MGLSSWIQNVLARSRAKAEESRAVRKDFVHLFLTRLEDRRVLNADFSLVAGDLQLSNFSQATDENLTIQETADDYLFVLSEGNWSGTDATDVTGNAQNTLTIDKSLITGTITIDGTGVILDIGFDSANFSALTGGLDIDGAGGITQGAGSTLSVSTFDAAANSVALNEATNDFDTLILSAAADASLQDADEVLLGPVTAGGNFSLIASGGISESLTPGPIAAAGNLTLSAGGNIGAAGAGALDVRVGGTASLSATGSDIHITSDQNLTIDHLETAANQPDTVEITTTGTANLTLSVTAAEFVNLETDNISLTTADGILAIQGETLSAGSLTLSHGASGSITLAANLQTDGGDINLQNAPNVTLAATVTLDTELGDDNDAGDVLFSAATGAAINAATPAAPEGLFIDTTTGAIGGIDGNISLSDVGTGVRLGLLSIIAGDGIITLNDTTGSEILTTGTITFGSFTQLTSNTTISTLGGDVNWQNTTVFSDPGGPYNLSIDTDGGNVQLGRFSDSGGLVPMATFINDLSIDTTTGATAGTLDLHGDITLANNFSYTGGTATFRNSTTSAIGINSSLLVQGTGSVQISATSGTSDVVMEDGTSLTTTDGDATIAATNNVQLSRIIVGGTHSADITAGNAITDGTAGEGLGFENIIADSISLTAANGIGSGSGVLGDVADIDIDGGTLSASNSTLGAIQIFEVDDIALDQVANAGRAVVIEAGGAITDADIGNEGLTNENIIAASVRLQAVTGIGSGTGALGEGEDIDISATVLFANNTGAGNVQILSVGDIAVEQILNTGIVALEADGAITDADPTDDAAANLIAGQAALLADTGIGSDLTPDADIDTTVGILAAQTTTGDIHIDSTVALMVGMVGGIAGLRIVTGTGDDDITVTAAGDLNIDGPVQNSTGDINLTAAGDLTVASPIQNGTGDINLTATADLFINGNVLTTAPGNITLTGQNVTFNSDGTAPNVEITGDGTIATTDPRNGPVTGTGIITIIAPGITSINDGSTIRTGGGVIQFTTNDIEIDNSALVQATGGTVMIRNATGGREIALGGITAGTLNISQTDLGGIVADSLRIGRRDLDNAANSAGTITFTGAFSSLSPMIVQLFGGADVVQNAGAGFIAETIGIDVAGSVVLGDNTNDARTALAIRADGGILFNDANSLTIGQIADDVDNALSDGEAGIVGILSTTSFVDLRTVDGDLTVPDLGVAAEISAAGVNATNMLAVNLLAAGVENFINIGLGANVSSTVGSHRYTADNMDIQGTITAPLQALPADPIYTVHLRNANPNVAINLGAADVNGNATLELTDAELDNITAQVLAIGRDTAGNITVSAAINPDITGTLHLITGQMVLDTPAGAIAETNLLIEADGGATLNQGSHNVDTLAAVVANPGANFTFRDVDTLIVGTVTGLTVSTDGNETAGVAAVAGITTAGGNVDLTTVTGELRVDNDITTAGGDIALTALAGNVNINTGNLDATGLIGGNVTLQAIGANSDIQITGNITTNDGSINITADDALTLAGDIATTGLGTVMITANNSSAGGDSDGLLTMNPGSSITAENGAVTLQTIADLADQASIIVQQITTMTGSILIDANGSIADIIVRNILQTTDGGVTLTANDTIVFEAAGMILATSTGNVVVQANQDASAGDSGDQLVMADGSVINSGTGTVTLLTEGANGGNIILGQVITQNATNGAVTIRSASAVLDTDDAGAADIIALDPNSRVNIVAVTGVGIGNPIETNAVAFDVQNTGVADINIDNTTIDLAVSIERMTTLGGSITFNNSGAGLLTIEDTGIATGIPGFFPDGGNITITTSDNLLVTTLISTRDGRGGSFTLTGGAIFDSDPILMTNAAIQLGTGSINITTGSDDIFINTVLVVDNGPSTFRAPRDIFIGDADAAVEQLISRVDDGTGTDNFVDATAVVVQNGSAIDSHIELTADFDGTGNLGNGDGGVLVRGNAQVVASGNLTISGSNLADDGTLGVDATIENGVHIEADLGGEAQLLAAGRMTLQNQPFSATADIVIGGLLQTKIDPGTVPAPDLTITINPNQNIHLADDTTLFSPTNVTLGNAGTTADAVIDDLDGTTPSKLVILSGQLTTIYGRVGDIVGITDPAERIGSLETDAGGNTLFLGGFITTLGPQIYRDNVFLHAITNMVGSTTFTTTDALTGNVTFNQVVRGFDFDTAATGSLIRDDLILNVARTTIFSGQVGVNLALDPAADPSQRIGDGDGPAITILSPGETQFNSTVFTQSGILQDNNAGRITFREDLSLDAGNFDSEFRADVTLDSLVIFSNGNLTFGNNAPDEDELRIDFGSGIDTATQGANITINSRLIDDPTAVLNRDLRLNLGQGNLQINGDVGLDDADPMLDNRFGDLVVVSANNFTFAGQSIFSETLTQMNGQGTTVLNGTIDTSLPEGVTLASANFMFNADVVTDGGRVLTQASGNITHTGASSFTTDGGIVVSDALGSIFMAEDISGTATIATDGGMVVLQAGGNLVVSRIVSPAGIVSLISTNGAIVDSGDQSALGGTSDVQTAQLFLDAQTGIGTPATNAVLEVEVTLLEARVGTGGLFLSNTGTLIVGDIATMPAFTVRADVPKIINPASVGGVTSGGGGVFIETLGATSDLQVAGFINDLAGGNVTLLAGNDFLLQNGPNPADLQATANGQINVVAQGDVIFSPGAFVQVGPFGILQPTPVVTNILTPQVGTDGTATLTFDLGLPGESGFVVIVDWGDENVSSAVDVIRNVSAGTQILTHLYENPPDANNPGANIRVFLVATTHPNIHFFGDNVPTLFVPEPPLPNERQLVGIGDLIQPPPTSFILPPRSNAPISVDALVNLAVPLGDLGLITNIPEFEVPTTGFGGVSVIESVERPPFFVPGSSVQALPDQDTDFDSDAEEVDFSSGDAEDEGQDEVQVRLRVLSPAGQVLFEYDIESRYLSNPLPLWQRLTDGRYQIVIVEPGSSVPIVVRDVQLKDHKVIRRFDRTQRGSGEDSSQLENESEVRPVSWEVPLPESFEETPAPDPDGVWENWTPPSAAGRFLAPATDAEQEADDDVSTAALGAFAGGLALTAIKARAASDPDDQMSRFSQRALSPAARLRRRLRK